VLAGLFQSDSLASIIQLTNNISKQYFHPAAKLGEGENGAT